MVNQAPGSSIVVAFARATLYLPLFLLLSPTYSKGRFLKLALIIFSHTRWMILSHAQSFNFQFTDDTLIILKACQESDTSNLSYLRSPK